MGDPVDEHPGLKKYFNSLTCDKIYEDSLPIAGILTAC